MSVGIRTERYNSFLENSLINSYDGIAYKRKGLRSLVSVKKLVIAVAFIAAFIVAPFALAWYTTSPSGSLGSPRAPAIPADQSTSSYTADTPTLNSGVQAQSTVSTVR